MGSGFASLCHIKTGMHACDHMLGWMDQIAMAHDCGNHMHLWRMKQSTNLWAKEAADLAALTFVKCTEGVMSNLLGHITAKTCPGSCITETRVMMVSVCSLQFSN